MKFCCITPCLNSEKYIEKTILSVLDQSIFSNKNTFLHYIIQDGNSSDNTIKIIKKIISDYSQMSNISIELISESDKSMYDAIAKGFRKLSSGDIYSYINAGDFYPDYSFELVANTFANFNVKFLTGINCIYNEDNHIIDTKFPLKYYNSFIRKGIFGTILPNIQQESTFWNKELHDNLDLNKLSKFQLAGDFFLWKTFSKFSELDIIYSWIGGFKVHKGQLTENNILEYKKELKIISDKSNIFDILMAYLIKFFWFLPEKIKIKLNPKIIRFDPQKGIYFNERILHDK